MQFTPDQIIFWQSGIVKLNATIVFTWVVMMVLVAGSIALTKSLDAGLVRAPGGQQSRWQNFLEVLIDYGRRQLSELGISNPDVCLPFVATIFLFIASCSLASIVPGFHTPTASLSTTAALAACVLVAVPIYGVSASGLGAYLHRYIEPSWVMLPFQVLGEATRTIALAVRLFGNSMSETMIVAVCLTVAPLFFPILMKTLGLLTGLVQAYIFAILAALYIAAGISIQKGSQEPTTTET